MYRHCLCVERLAALHVLHEPHLALDRDDGAPLLLGELSRGLHDLRHDGALLHFHEELEHGRAADPGQRGAQLRLEHDEDRDDPHELAGLEDLVEGFEPEELSQVGRQHEHDEAHHHLERARAADQSEQLVDDEGDDGDVDDVRHRRVEEAHAGPVLDHVASSTASR